MTVNRPKQLVIGFAMGLTQAALDPFLRSLHETGYRGDVCLFFGPTDTQARSSLSNRIKHSPVVHPPTVGRLTPLAIACLRHLKSRPRLAALYRIAFAVMAGTASNGLRSKRWLAFQYHLVGVCNLRHLYYQGFLDDEGAGYDQVLITDIRDVIFQADPFTRAEGELEVALESDAIKASPFNRLWIAEAYGERACRKLENELVSCAGTTRGKGTGVKRYLHLMCSELATVPCSGIHDQAIHNYLLHTGQLEWATALTNGESDILTAGTLPFIQIDANSDIRNASGTRPSIVHQYDRHRTAQEMVSRRYSAKH